MININNAKLYCCEDISLIENYEAAINSSHVYDCHHRLDTDLGLTKTELIEQNLYYNRPASELIYLTHAEHTILHMTGSKRSEETKSLLSKQKKKFYEDPTERQKAREAQKKRWLDPKEHEKHRARMNTLAAKANNSAAQKKRYEDPVERQKTREAAIGKNLNKRHMSNGVDHVFINPDKIDYYLERGYHFGMK